MPNLGIFFFSRNFAVRQNDADIMLISCWYQWWYHIWQNYLQTLAQKKPNQTFLVSNWNIFIFTPNLATRQVQDADFKYENIFLKLQPKNTQIRHCSFLFYVFSFFHKTLQSGKFEFGAFKYENIFFQILTQRWLYHTLLIPYLRIFIFALNFATRQIQGRWY